MIAPAKTGNASNSKIAVTKIAHENKLILWRFKPPALIFKTVLIKLIANKKIIYLFREGYLENFILNLKYININ